MENRQTVVRASLGALSSLALQNQDDGRLDPSRVNGHPHVLDERTGRSRTVPPPARRARPHDIGCINEKHGSSLIDPTQCVVGTGRTRSPCQRMDAPHG